jgi:hypothetical protein
LTNARAWFDSLQLLSVNEIREYFGVYFDSTRFHLCLALFSHAFYFAFFFICMMWYIYRKIKNQFSTADAFYWQYTETKSSMLKNKKRCFWNEVNAHFNDTSKHIRNYMIDYNNCLLKEKKPGISHLLLSAFFFFFLRSVCVRQKRKKNRLFSSGQYQYYKRKTILIVMMNAK